MDAILLTVISTSTLRPIQLPMQWVTGIKWPRLQVNHSPPSRAKLRMHGPLLSSALYTFMAFAHRQLYVHTQHKDPASNCANAVPIAKVCIRWWATTIQHWRGCSPTMISVHLFTMKASNFIFAWYHNERNGITCTASFIKTLQEPPNTHTRTHARTHARTHRITTRRLTTVWKKNAQENTWCKGEVISGKVRMLYNKELFDLYMSYSLVNIVKLLYLVNGFR
jgi:hypothetical protein